MTNLERMENRIQDLYKELDDAYYTNLRQTTLDDDFNNWFNSEELKDSFKELSVFDKKDIFDFIKFKKELSNVEEEEETIKDD